MPRFRKLVSVSDSYTSSSIASRRPANRERACTTDSNFSSALSPGTRLAVARAPALTIGFMVRSALSSMAMTESKGSPVLLTPSLRRASSGPSASQTRAKTKSLEMLWMVNSTSASPMAYTPPPTPATQTPKASGGASASAGM